MNLQDLLTTSSMITYTPCTGENDPMGSSIEK